MYAYRIFFSLSRKEPENVAIWAWLAKTAPTLSEFEHAFNQINRLEPTNSEIIVLQSKLTKLQLRAKKQQTTAKILGVIGGFLGLLGSLYSLVFSIVEIVMSSPPYPPEFGLIYILALFGIIGIIGNSVGFRVSLLVPKNPDKYSSYQYTVGGINLVLNFLVPWMIFGTIFFLLAGWFGEKSTRV